MNEDNKYIRFDWAMKHMLRDKANFSVLEGFLTVLIGDKVTIEEILESESNQDSDSDKFNRVDIKAKNSEGHIIIVEVQLTRQLHYLQRILYGVSKAVTEHISLGDKYDKIKKVYSISILYCDMGKGDDYVYHGKTVFRGVHTGSDLIVNNREKNTLIPRLPEYVFPEYYIIRVNEFDKIPASPLDEWMEYLKTGRINENATAPGLQEARTKLQYLNMSAKDRTSYDAHIDNIMVQNDVFETAKFEGFLDGHMEGMKEGIERGMKEGMKEGIERGIKEGMKEGIERGIKEGMKEGILKEKYAVASRLKAIGMSTAEIASVTGLTPLQIEEGVG